MRLGSTYFKEFSFGFENQIKIRLITISFNIYCSLYKTLLKKRNHLGLLGSVNTILKRYTKPWKIIRFSKHLFEKSRQTNKHSTSVVVEPWINSWVFSACNLRPAWCIFTELHPWFSCDLTWVFSQFGVLKCYYNENIVVLLSDEFRTMMNWIMN